MIKAADFMFLPIALAVAIVAQLTIFYCVTGPFVASDAAFFMTQALVAVTMFQFTRRRDFLRCRSGHPLLLLGALAAAVGATWASLYPAIAIVCLIAGECF